jgi:hypothetical protein
MGCYFSNFVCPPRFYQIKFKPKGEHKSIDHLPLPNSLQIMPLKTAKHNCTFEQTNLMQLKLRHLQYFMQGKCAYANLRHFWDIRFCGQHATRYAVGTILVNSETQVF